jgi:hypothetical protein
MEKVTSVREFMASLPRVPKRKVWNVMMDGRVVQGVSASDNRRETAEAYIASKYPGKTFTLEYTGWKIGKHGSK